MTTLSRTVKSGTGTDIMCWTALVQGAYYVLTGVWSLLHIDSFMAVTGPKTDIWLVKTVGVLVLVIGAVYLLAGRRRRFTPEVVLLGVGAALALGLVEVVYVSAGRISSIYLLDALAEAVFIAGWVFGLGRAGVKPWSSLGTPL
jgi:hypothetical protein